MKLIIALLLIYATGRDVIENYYIIKHRRTIGKNSKIFKGPKWVLVLYSLHGLIYLGFGLFIWNYIDTVRPSLIPKFYYVQIWIYIIGVNIITRLRKELDAKYLIDN